MNKSFIFIAALLFIFQVSRAQTEKGAQTLGADIQILSSTNTTVSTSPGVLSSYTTTTKNTNFNLGPNYSYFIANQLDIAASLNYASAVNNNTDNLNSFNPSKQHSTGYGAKLSLRKYFMYTDKFGIRTGPFIDYSKTNETDTYSGASAIDNSTNKTDNFNAGVNLAVVYYPSKRLGVSASLASLNYNHYKTDSGNQGHSSGDDVNFNFINDGLSLSIFYVFGKK